MAPRDLESTSLEQIGERLQALREAMGLSQVDLCELIGCSTQEWNNWELGNKRPIVDNGIKITRATGVSLDWIYLGDIRGLPYDLATKIQARVKLPEKAKAKRHA